MFSKISILEKLRVLFFKDVVFLTLGCKRLESLEKISSKRVHAVARRYLSRYVSPTDENTFNKLMRISQIEDFYWRILIPKIWIRSAKNKNEIIIHHGLKNISPFKTWRFSFQFLGLFKFLVSFVFVLISLNLFRVKHENIFIKESVNGFRYKKIINSLEKEFDYATCSIGDVLRHPFKLISGRVLFIGLYIPPEINLRNSSVTVFKIISLFTWLLHRKAKKINYKEIHSYDKISTSFWFLHARKQLKFYQHGVIGPSYFNIGNKNLFYGLLKYDFVPRFMEPLTTTSKIVEFKDASNVVFFNEFLANYSLQRKLMNKFLNQGSTVFYKDRPKSDFYSNNNIIEGLKIIDDLRDIPDGSLCCVFHSAVIYDIPSSANIILIDNFIFSPAEIDKNGWIEYDNQKCLG